MGVDVIDTPRSDRFIPDELCLLQYLEVLGHSRPTDWQVSRDLAHRGAAQAKALEDRASRGIGKGGK